MRKTSASKENLKQFVAEKEQEWYKAFRMRVDSLEELCTEKSTKLEHLEKKYTKLKESFQYNIQLISQRDKELDHFEIMVKDLGAKLNVANIEVSEAKIREDESLKKLNECEKSQTELRMHFQQLLREKQAEIDNYRMGKEFKLDQERKEYEDMKRKLDAKLLQAEESFELQKRELAVGFDDALKKKEHEFRLKIDEINNAFKAEQIKVKISAKELEILKNSQQKTENALATFEQSQKELETTLKEKDWEIKNLTASHEVRQAELEAHLSAVGRNKNKMQEDFQRKFNEFDGNFRQKETEIQKLRTALLEQEKCHILAVSDLKSEKEIIVTEMESLKLTMAAKEQENEAESKRLKKELENINNKMESQRQKALQTTVQWELQVQELKADKIKMDVYIQELKDTIERYRKDMDDALERENALEQSKSQLNMDWQKKYESAERDGFQKSESLVQRLKKARDEALATVNEQKRQLQHRCQLLQTAKLEKNRAYEILSFYNIEIPEEDKLSFGNLEINDDTEKLLSLEEQNANLRTLIKEMRQEMSEIEKTQPVSLERNANSQNTDKRIPSVAEEYISSLETALKESKKENRLMKLNIPHAEKNAPPEVNKPGELNLHQIENTFIQTHIQSLNKTLGELKKEKTELLVNARKQQLRINFLEESLKVSAEKPQKKQIALDQLKYELNVSSQRSQSEINNLKKQISELELQLTEARGAADEYHRANLENNIEITTLKNEISSLKMELSQKRPTLNFGAQELTIQQLQEEILNLRQRAASLAQTDQKLTHQTHLSSDNDSNDLVAKMQEKLVNAIKRIAAISQDRQRLIDHNNRLQSELNKLQIKYPMFDNGSILTSTDPPKTPASGDRQMMGNGRLPQLEDLNYQLTKQELQYAQKYKTSDPKPSSKNDIPVRDVPKPLPDNSTSRPRSSLLRTSSEGEQSLLDIWKILEVASPISSVAPIQTTHSSEFQESDAGHKQPSKNDTQIGLRLKGKNQSKKTPKPKIRNYNFKDDD